MSPGRWLLFILLTTSIAPLFSQQKAFVQISQKYSSEWEPGWNQTVVLSEFSGLEGYTNYILGYRDDNGSLILSRLNKDSSSELVFHTKSEDRWTHVLAVPPMLQQPIGVYFINTKLNAERFAFLKKEKLTFSSIRKIRQKNVWTHILPFQGLEKQTLFYYQADTGFATLREVEDALKHKWKKTAPINLIRNLCDFALVIYRNTTYLAALENGAHKSLLHLFKLDSHGVLLDKNNRVPTLELEGSYDSLELHSPHSPLLLLYNSKTGKMTPFLMEESPVPPMILTKLNDIFLIPGADSFDAFYSLDMENSKKQEMDLFLHNSGSGETVIYGLKLLK